MKTLKEQVNEIVNASISKAAKAAALKKLCITPYEIELMLDGHRIINTGTPLRYIFTFGVEIECGVNRDRLMDVAAVSGVDIEYQGYNHNDNHRCFKFVTDGSLHLPGAIECVSPVLRGNIGKSALKNACKMLNQAGAIVNRSCGLHVHIGVANITARQFTNTFVNYAHLETLIDTFMAPSRRGDVNQYAHTLQNHNSLAGCATIEQVQSELGRNRYHKVNPMSWERHRTIEFRQHQGTTDYAKILNWVQFCGKLVVWSKTNRLTQDITSIDDVPFLDDKEKAFFSARIREFEAR